MQAPLLRPLAIGLLLANLGCQSGPRRIPGPEIRETAVGEPEEGRTGATDTEVRMDTVASPRPEDTAPARDTAPGRTVFDDTKPTEDTSPVSGTQHPCQSSSLPGSNDPTITACVCALDPFCCEGPWDSLCTAYAASPVCGALCDCSTWEAADLACGHDSDCTFCDDDNPCNGVWQCVAAHCALSAPVQCDTSGDGGCLVNTCNPFKNQCEPTPDPQACDDGNFCTAETCAPDTGECTSSPLPGCGENHPCAAANTPTSSDPVITDCVCALDPFCCETAWEPSCAEAAESQCGQSCDCTTFAAEALSCSADGDCGFCDDNSDLCDGAWQCKAGSCNPVPPVGCDSVNDAGCVANLCTPTLGICSLQTLPGACADNNVCTLDSCSLETALCSNTAIPSCKASDYSCSGVCPEATFQEGKPCQCDAKCLEYGDCCEDRCVYCDDPEACAP